MKTDHSEDSVKFMGESLLNHARAIYRYAKTYCEPNRGNDYIDAASRAFYSGHLAAMLCDMDKLMLMADGKGVMPFCNHEQIDAYIEAAQEIAAPRPVVDFSALLLN